MQNDTEGRDPVPLDASKPVQPLDLKVETPFAGWIVQSRKLPLAQSKQMGGSNIIILRHKPYSTFYL